jgi:hypothetical protein
MLAERAFNGFLFPAKNRNQEAFCLQYTAGAGETGCRRWHAPCLGVNGLDDRRSCCYTRIEQFMLILADRSANAGIFFFLQLLSQTKQRRN